MLGLFLSMEDLLLSVEDDGSTTRWSIVIDSSVANEELIMSSVMCSWFV